MPFASDDRSWPLLRVEASGESSDEDIESYLRELSRQLARKQPHVVIVDATKGRSLRATHRKSIADWNRTNAAELKRYRLGLAVVAPNPLLRGLITAVYWLFPAPFPYRCFERDEQAEAWARSLFR
jgi:hypothetical protein